MQSHGLGGPYFVDLIDGDKPVASLGPHRDKGLAEREASQLRSFLSRTIAKVQQPGMWEAVRSLSGEITRQYPTKRKLKTLVDELDTLPAGQREAMQRDLQRVLITLDELLSLIGERELQSQ